jgi:hypothetical protein
MNILNILTGGLAGGITGIIGSISSAIANYKLKKLEYQHEKEMQELNLKKIELQSNLAKTNADILTQIKELEALTKSQETLSKQYFKESYFQYLPDWSKPIIAIMLAVLDFLRGLVRPVLTVYIVGLVTWIGYSTYKTNPSAFNSSAELLVQVILYLSSTAFSWWFSDRSIVKFIQQKLK